MSALSSRTWLDNPGHSMGTFDITCLRVGWADLGDGGALRVWGDAERDVRTLTGRTYGNGGAHDPARRAKRTRKYRARGFGLTAAVIG